MRVSSHDANDNRNRLDWRCPACHGRDEPCRWCSGEGFVASRRSAFRVGRRQRKRPPLRELIDRKRAIGFCIERVSAVPKHDHQQARMLLTTAIKHAHRLIELARIEMAKEKE